jgi:molecular chaperone DnaK
LKEDYYLVKENCRWLLSKINNPMLHKKFEDITTGESEWLAADSTNYIKRKTDDLWNLGWQIRRKDVEYVTQLYLYYAMKADDEYKDAKKAALLKKRGDEALERKNADEITGIIYQLYELLINKPGEEPLEGTGLRG